VSSVGELKCLLQKAQTNSMKFAGPTQSMTFGGQEQALVPFVSPFVGNGGNPMPVREDKVVDFDTEGHVLRVHVSRSIGAGTTCFKPRGIRKKRSDTNKKNTDGSKNGSKNGSVLLRELAELGMF